jgi:lysozyme
MDVSSYQGTIDWPTAKASGISFAIAKATESTNFTDPTFATNWAGMKSAGVARGAYHFFHADVDPVAQANYFLGVVGALEPGDLPVVLDFEQLNGQSEATAVANAVEFLQTVTSKTGLTAMVYLSPGFLSSYSGLEPYDLWVANWNVTCPDVPSNWSTWTLWQESDTGSVQGVPATVDLDTFNGTLSQLGSLGLQPQADGGSGADAGGGVDAGRDAATPPPPPPPLDASLPSEDAGGSGQGYVPQFGAQSRGCSIGTTAGGGAGRWIAVAVFTGLGTRRRRRASRPFSGS